MVAPPSRIQWIQFQELVVGENHPVYPDNDNRPLKQMIQFSNLSPQAADFPGFIGCYQGNEDPNGFQVGNVRNAFWNVATGILWMKQTGDNTNTGWVEIGGSDHLSGDGSPESVATVIGDPSPNGKFYDQQDNVDFQPTWVKRQIPIVTPISADWFSGATGDIDGRTPDGGASLTPFPLRIGTWTKHPAAAAGEWDITLISAARNVLTNMVATPDESIYFIADLTYSNDDQSAEIVVAYTGDSRTSGTGKVGVGIRWNATTLNGYLVIFDFGNIFVLYKVVAGVKTVLDTGYVGEVVIADTANVDVKTDISFGIRAVGDKIQVWVQGKRVLDVTDTTFPDVGVAVLYGLNLSTTNTYSVRAITTGDVIISSNTQGWYSQNGFERGRNLAIGNGAVAFSIPEQYGMDPAEDYDPYQLVVQYNVANPCIAIGDHALASLPRLTGTNTGFGLTYQGAIAIGSRSIANGSGAVALGDFALAQGERNIAIGQSEGIGNDNTAIGGAYAEGIFCVAIGPGTVAIGDSTVVIGKFSSTDIAVIAGVLIGKNGFLEQNTVNPIGLGTDAYVTEPAIDAIGIGHSVFIDGVDYCIAIGSAAQGLHAYGIALGTQAETVADNSWMFGADDATALLKELLFNGGPGASVRGPNIVCGTGALGTTDTDGFLYIPTCDGLPTGVPTAYPGMLALVYDSTNKKLCVYDGGWLKTAALT